MKEQRHSKRDQNQGGTLSGPELYLVVLPEIVPPFIRLLSEGFFVDADAGQSIHEFLTREFGIQEAYLNERIQTIFLNGKAVDDTHSAILRQGARLALSAAMPGMVGSTFRKAGIFAKMRSQISHAGDAGVPAERKIRVQLKLFNLIAKELGPLFLQRGVWLNGNRIQKFIAENSDELMRGCKAARLAGRGIGKDQLLQIKSPAKWIALRLEGG